MAQLVAGGSPFIEHLRQKVGRHLERARMSQLYQLCTAPDVETSFLIAVTRNILLETFSYGPHVTEATFTAIGRFPKLYPDLMRVAIEHDIEEVNHGEIALADFVKMGGSEEWARKRPMTPQSFAMAAAVRLLAIQESPFSYLGYMYLFEALTSPLAQRVQQVLAQRGIQADKRVFIDMHAVEDIKHEQDLAQLIERIVGEFPNVRRDIEYGFDVFASVYPLPIWDAVLNRSLEEVADGVRGAV